MAVETVISTPQIYSTTVGTLKAILIAHPVGIVVAGGALVGTGSYFLMKKFFNKKKEPVTENVAPATA